MQRLEWCFLRQNLTGKGRYHPAVRAMVVQKSARAPAPSTVVPSPSRRASVPHLLRSSGCLTGWGFSLSLAGYVGAIAGLYGTGAASFRDAELWLSVSFLAYLVYASLVEWQGYGWARCEVVPGTSLQQRHMLRARRVQWPWCLVLTGVMVYCALTANGALMAFAQISGRYDAIAPGLLLEWVMVVQVLYSLRQIQSLRRSVNTAERSASACKER